MNQPFVSIVVTPFINGLTYSWTSNTSLTVAAGSCSNDINTNVIEVADESVLDCTVSGANGVQGGALAASKKYNLYAIGDSTKFQPGAFYAARSDQDLYLPAGYNIKKRIGTFLTDGSSHILEGYQTGYGVDRTWTFDAPISVLSGGTSATYVAIDLSAYLPEIGTNMQVLIKGAFTPNASGDLATFAQGDSTATAGQAVITGFEAAKAEVETVSLPASADMEIKYKVTASGSLTAYLAGYVDSL